MGLTPHQREEAMQRLTEGATQADLARSSQRLGGPADPKALRRLVQFPEQLWAEVKRDSKPTFRTLAKAHAALAIAILTYIPLRVQNLSDLAFDSHLFLRAGTGAIPRSNCPMAR
jgi:hypothetical protein